MSLTIALAIVFYFYRKNALPSGGFQLDLATAPKECGDGDPIVLSALGGRRVTLGSRPPFDLGELRSRLRNRLQYRSERLIFVRAEPGIEFGEFVQLVDEASQEAEIVSLITPQVETQASARFCLEPSCGQCGQFRAPR